MSCVKPRGAIYLFPKLDPKVHRIRDDEKLVFATAWEPYQELFQGVIRCLHSDFRLGGLAPGETLQIKGKIYLVKNDETALLKRYRNDFPGHKALHSKGKQR